MLFVSTIRDFEVIALVGAAGLMLVGDAELRVMASSSGQGRELEKTQRGRPFDGGGPGGDAELHVGVAKVGLHRVEREVQVRCHVDVGEPLRELLEHAYLGVGERVGQPGHVGTGRATPYGLAGPQRSTP